MKKKTQILFLTFLVMTFLVGWGKKEVELLNDQKLINLKEAIEFCRGGNNTDNSQDDLPNDNPPITIVPSPDDVERTITISIRDRKITYEAQEFADIEDLELRIRQDCGTKIVFRLVDDYAEAHVYKEVRRVLIELYNEIGLCYTME